MVGYYEYDTSPRKLDDEFYTRTTRIKTPNKKVTTTKKARTKASTKAKTSSKKDFKLVLEICLVFAMFAVIGYRVSIINSSLKEKEALKAQLAEMKKQNEQLQVNIEQQMNINTIEQEAKEKLGMQKLDNNQKVYITLPKEDYTESSVATIQQDEEETSWWGKLLKDLFGIK